MSQKPCIVCGEVSEGSRCEQHQPTEHRRGRPSRAAGYDASWDRLSRRARRMQPFCSDCGSTESLTADHSPQAWQRKEQGKSIRLVDIDVVCIACNNQRGPARRRKQEVRPLPKVSEEGNALTRGDAPPSPLSGVVRQQQQALHTVTEIH